MLHTITDPILHSEMEASKLILNNIRESYVFLNTELKIVYFNARAQEQACAYLGWELYIGLPIIELVHESRKALLSKVYKEVLHGKRFVSENEHVASNGTKIFFENTFQPAYNEKNEVVGAIITSRNITDKKLSEQAIQESEERLQFALEAANQVAWDWNLQTNEVIYSGSYKKLYGFAENELKNDFSEWVSRIHPDDRKKMQELVTEHIQSRNLDHDSQYRIRDGEGRYRWIMAKGRLVSFDEAGNPLRMIGTHTDITNAVSRELELKQINERFNCMMRATHELLWEWDIVNNKIFRSKDGVRNELELAEGGPVEKMEQLLQRVHPDDMESVHEVLNAVLKAPHGHTFELEYRFRRRNGEYAYVYDRAILLRDENNNPVRVIGSVQNISERKRLEKELLNNELEYQRLLHQATVESQEKERAEIGKELHDNINQVLTTTKLYLDLARTNNELKEELIAKSLTNINSIIQEIRLLSRSLMDPSIGDLGLGDTIRDLIENIHLIQKIKIEFCADEAIETVLNSQQKLTLFRIIQESLNNVLRHSSATSVRMEITISSDQVKLVISDNGVGFLPEITRKGAGLKNIQNRIYLINGTLQLESSPGKGCSIRLQFPIALTS
ncbi:MAG TPA: PAS domain-containing protein [Flavisolibacter sp.]|jgi:PAS domain S-box-containing protein|nr:PAS domain-containing protein [Flavisolibacter sp.]